MLPRGTSYDWAEDGGITRPVHLLVTPPVYADRLAIDARPNLDQNTAAASVSCRLHNTTDAEREVTLRGRIVEEDTGRWVADPVEASVTVPAGGTRQVELRQMTWSDPQLWHFDHPHLYHAVLDVHPDEGPAHRETDHFGVRSITVSDGHFSLNGEQVSLMGVERMAGSHPSHGMAEPEDWIEHDHDDMKELNCIFTRVHWPQDRRVLDYCDRHGILIQTEVPAWGPDTFNDMSGDPDDAILQNGLEQLREMIHRDRNHPSIFSWGLCNETDGTHPPSYRFTQRLYDEAKRLDPNRLCSYASNTLQDDPSDDRATDTVDFIMWNEYYESWYGGTPEDADENLVRIHEAFPEKPIVVSEYGYCECTPDRMAGDEERIQILKEHTAKYRKHDFVGGAIFFSYNDYRTHIGDKGQGAIKQRVHGVVDLFGRQKPSFQALRRHSSPVEVVTLSRADDALTATIRARSTVPAYPMHDYTLRWVVYGFGDLPMEQHEVALPSLSPGDETTIDITFDTYEPGRLTLDVIRPNGHSAYTDDWTL
jgi:beta-glucuronidase